MGDVAIHAEETPIPNWKKCVSNEQNKVELCNYLVKYLKAQAVSFVPGKLLVIGGGSQDTAPAFKIIDGICEPCVDLHSDHEEADTNMMLHTKDAFQDHHKVTISSPDTDVFILATYHFNKLKCIHCDNP